MISYFLQKLKNRRFFIWFLALTFIIIFSGSIVVLAKTGKINFKLMADTLGIQSNTGNGLKATYWKNNSLNQAITPVRSQVDPQIAFNWGELSPHPSVPANYFSVRWEGYLQAPYAGTYTIYLGSDDGTRMWINNSLLIDNWSPHPYSEQYHTIYLNAGQKYPIKVEYFEQTIQAKVYLMWSCSRFSKRVIEQKYLYTDTNGGVDLGTYSIEGIITSSSGQKLSGAKVYFDIDTRKYATTNQNGYYRLSNLPIQDNVSMSRHSYSYYASGYQNRTSLGLVSYFKKNPNNQKTGALYTNMNVRLSPNPTDFPEFRFNGNVKDQDGKYIPNIKVEIIDKNLTGNQIIASTDSQSGGIYSDGKNYQTATSFPRENLENVYIRFTPPNDSGYTPHEIRVLDDGVVTKTTLVGDENVTYQLKTIRDVRLVRFVSDLYYKITTACNDNDRCPNRNSAGMIEGIPIAITGQSPEQLSSNSFSPAGFSGVLSGITAGERELVVNAPNSSNYISAYSSKIETIDLAKIQKENIPGIGVARCYYIKLQSNKTYIPQSDTFDFQGLVKEQKTGKLMEADVRIECKNNLNCDANFGPAIWRLSKLEKEKTNGSYQNFLFEGLKNIARAGSGIDELELSVTKPGWYIDLNNNNFKDANETGIFKFRKGDITPPSAEGGKSVCKKNYSMKKISASNIRISGSLKIASGSSVNVDMKLLPVKADGSLDENAAVASRNLIANKAGRDYAINFPSSLIDFNADYMLVAAPKSDYSTEMIPIRFTNQTAYTINFIFQKNVGEYFVFTGQIQNIDNLGRAQNILDAEVSATVDGVEIDGAVIDDETEKYRLEFTDDRLFGANSYSSEGQESVVVELTGFNGKSWEASKHKTYKFTLRKGQGILIHRDFKFYSDDVIDVLPATKTVKINLTKQIKDYRSITTNNTYLINQSAPIPFAGVKVQLVSKRSSNLPGSSGYYIIRSSEAITDAKGQVEFPDYPREAAEIQVQIVDQGLIPEGGDELFNLTDSQTTKTINYYKLSWDPNTLKESKKKIQMQQCNSSWASMNIPDEPFANTICGAGCCLTSLSMAMKFYYPNDKFDGNGMNPRVLYNFVKNRASIAMMGGFPQVAELVNAKYKTNLRVTDISFEQLASYVKSGIPVIIHSTGLRNPSGTKHGNHCFLVTDISSKGLYGIINPNASPAIYYVTRAQLGHINHVQAVTTSESRNYFLSVSGHVSSSNFAFASGGEGNDNARTDSDYLVTANIGSYTAAKIQTVFLKYKRPGWSDYLFKMNKDGDNYSYAIPKHLISKNFSYSFLAINDFGAEIESDDYPVTTNSARYTPAVGVSRAFSYFKFQVYNYNDVLSGANLRSALIRAYKTFQNGFNNFLSRMKINRSSLVTVSGEVVNGSGELVPTVIVKIWENAKLSTNGKFAIPDVKRGRVPVEVIDQETGRNYVLTSPTLDVKGRMKNLRIVIDDPLDVGALNARVFWQSTASSQINNNTTLRTGKIQLIRNGQIKKAIDLRKTAGRVNISALQVGSYTVKYFMPDKTERNIYLSKGGNSNIINIEKGKTAINDIRVNDMSKFTVKITSNDSIVKCKVYYWGHLYVTKPSGTRVDYAKAPKNCEIKFTDRPGRYYFQMLANYGYNRTITPAYIDVPPAANGAVYEIKLW